GMISLSPPTICNSAFALDVAARHRVQFSMPESDAVSMLKRIP
ncbi:TPA: phage integrase family protein, partial [Escherichia coli]